MFYVYKMTSKNFDKCYIGLTKNVGARIRSHWNHFNQQGGKDYISSEEVLKRGDVDVTVLQQVDVDDITKAYPVEDKYISENNCVNIQRIRPYRNKYADYQNAWKSVKRHCDKCDTNISRRHFARHCRSIGHLSE